MLVLCSSLPPTSPCFVPPFVIQPATRTQTTKKNTTRPCAPIRTYGCTVAAMLAREGMMANTGEPSLFTRPVNATLGGFFFSEFLIIAGVGLDSLVGSYVDLRRAKGAISETRMAGRKL